FMHLIVFFYLFIYFFFFFFFFFSSRRRHTRLQGDWSSDVCSSDLFRDIFCKKCRENPGRSVIPDLRFNPCWDSLRRDKRFDKIRSEERRVGKECRYRWWLYH